MLTDDQLKTKREKTRLRVEKHRARIKEIEAADLSRVDCPIEISKKEAKRILIEEVGLENHQAIDTVIHLAKTAAENFLLPFNYHLIRFGLQQTRLELEWKRLVREQFSQKVVSDDQFEYFVHEQLPSVRASGLSMEAWLKQQAEQKQEPASVDEEKKDALGLTWHYVSKG